MRPITGTDITDFYASRCDLLVLAADGEYAHLDTGDIVSSGYDDGRATAYGYATTAEGNEVQILLERTTIDEGEWFADALDDDGTLTPGSAAEMADIINQDGILPGRVLKAVEAGKRWQEAQQAADELAIARYADVAEVAAFCGGNQSAAARLLGLKQSTVNKLVRKSRPA